MGATWPAWARRYTVGLCSRRAAAPPRLPLSAASQPRRSLRPLSQTAWLIRSGCPRRRSSHGALCCGVGSCSGQPLPGERSNTNSSTAPPTCRTTGRPTPAARPPTWPRAWHASARARCSSPPSARTTWATSLSRCCRVREGRAAGAPLQGAAAQQLSWARAHAARRHARSCLLGAARPPAFHAPPAERGVDTSGVQRVGRPTRCILVTRRPDGDRVFAGFGKVGGRVHGGWLALQHAPRAAARPGPGGTPMLRPTCACTPAGPACDASSPSSSPSDHCLPCPPGPDP